jgi:predicted dithiol-disulfide oxidoreductase (DUF899 family)
VHGWPDHACPGCSLLADQVAHVAHLNARDSPEGYPQAPPCAWWNWHDEYGNAEPGSTS